MRIWKPLHLNGRRLWFTSDTHFNHRRIPVYCRRSWCLSDEENQKVNTLWEQKDIRSWCPEPSTIMRMDEILIELINRHVMVDDILWHLGDFCFGHMARLEEIVRYYRNRINCKYVYITYGNHDDEDAIDNVFNTDGRKFACERVNKYRWQGQKMTLNHYAQVFWNKSYKDAICLYGHSHSGAESYLDRIMPGRRSMDVGVDNAFKLLGEPRPFSFEEVMDRIGKNPGIEYDHHGRII